MVAKPVANSEQLEVEEQKRTAIIVLGMHRSGTSAWTRCLNLLGADLPNHVFGAASGNETGHWEAEKLVEFNNQFLEACGSRWDDWRAVDHHQLSPDEIENYRCKLREILREEYGDSRFLLIKDPRICRLAWLYREVLSSMRVEVKFLIPYRDPLSVIKSLHARDRMTEQFAAALWLRHILDAERFSVGAPRAFVSYDELLGDWSVVAYVGQQLGVTWAEIDEHTHQKLREFLNPSLRHHTSSIEDLEELPKLLKWNQEVYRALIQARIDDALELGGILEEIRMDFDQACRVLGDAIFRELRERENKYSEKIQEQLQHVEQVQAELEWQREDGNRELATYRLRQEALLAENHAQAAQLAQIRASLTWRTFTRVKQVAMKLRGRVD